MEEERKKMEQVKRLSLPTNSDNHDNDNSILDMVPQSNSKKLDHVSFPAKIFHFSNFIVKLSLKKKLKIIL